MAVTEKVAAARMWVLMHLGLVVAIASVALAVAAFALAPMLGAATRRPRP